MKNSTALGYMILAAKSLNYDVEQIKQLEYEMKVEMDFVREEDAEEAYRTF